MTAPSRLDIRAEYGFTHPDPNTSGRRTSRSSRASPPSPCPCSARAGRSAACRSPPSASEGLGFAGGFDSLWAVQLSWQNLIPACSGCPPVELYPQDIDPTIITNGTGQHQRDGAVPHAPRRHRRRHGADEQPLALDPAGAAVHAALALDGDAALPERGRPLPRRVPRVLGLPGRGEDGGLRRRAARLRPRHGERGRAGRRAREPDGQRLRQPLHRPPVLRRRRCSTPSGSPPASSTPPRTTSASCSTGWTRSSWTAPSCPTCRPAPRSSRRRWPSIPGAT